MVSDHLPLYRQEAVYARSGVPLARSTLAEWVGAVGFHLQPLVDRLRGLVLVQPVCGLHHKVALRCLHKLAVGRSPSKTDLPIADLGAVPCRVGQVRQDHPAAPLLIDWT